MPTTTRWTPTETLDLARNLTASVRRNSTDFADRASGSAEFLTATDDAITAAETGAAGQPVRLGGQKGATVAVETLIERAGARTAGIRKALMRALPDRKDVHKAFGTTIDGASSFSNAIAAIDAVLAGATSFPTETTRAGILERDLAAVRELRTELLSADRTQENAKSTKKGGTVLRDVLLTDVIARIDRIIADAELEYAENPAKLAEFKSAIPSKKKKPPKK
jgi:hypothetical protein